MVRKSTVRKTPTSALKVIAAAQELPPPPVHLGEAGRELWSNIQAGYAIGDPGGLALLAVAAEAADRGSWCRKQLEAGEVIFVNDVPRAHPAAAIERDARAGLIRALKELHLDVEPLRDRVGRPGRDW